MRRLRVLLLALAVAVFVMLAPILLCTAPAGSGGGALAAPSGSSAPDSAEALPTAGPAATPLPRAAGAPYRAVWVSYLEWQRVDFSTAATFTAAVRAMFGNIAAAGGTVVLAHLRPFGDALYPSALYPYSHLCTGTQGADPGYDPLAIMLAEAHALGLQLEGWLNPYRLQVAGSPALSAQSLPLTHPDWVKTVDGNLYLNPALPEVRQYIADGIAELCENYPLDGIHFDDYFYPTTDPEFDAVEYKNAATDLPLDAWRRQNVDALVALCCETAHRYSVRFGIAPVGEPDLNYEVQYSDTARWLAQGGYVDYLMPQLYWGLDYTKNGDTAKSAAQLAARWAALPRADGVALYAGLGAYRIGAGDGSGSDEWQSGHALADQIGALQVDGFGLYRYDSLWENAQYPVLAAAEVEQLRKLWAEAPQK